MMVLIDNSYRIAGGSGMSLCAELKAGATVPPSQTSRERNKR